MPLPLSGSNEKPETNVDQSFNAHAPQPPTPLIQTSKIHGYEFAYAGLLHGYAINNIYGAHGLFVVGYDDELRIFAELFYHVGKLAYVGIIERCIYLI